MKRSETIIEKRGVGLVLLKMFEIFILDFTSDDALLGAFFNTHNFSCLVFLRQ